MTLNVAPSFLASNARLQVCVWHSYCVRHRFTGQRAGGRTAFIDVNVSACVQDVTSFLHVNASALKEDRTLFQQSLAAFIAANEDPTTSPNFKSKVTDLPSPLLQLLEQASSKTDQDLVLLLLKVDNC